MHLRRTYYGGFQYFFYKCRVTIIAKFENREHTSLGLNLFVYSLLEGLANC